VRGRRKKRYTVSPSVEAAMQRLARGVGDGQLRLGVIERFEDGEQERAEGFALGQIVQHVMRAAIKALGVFRK
jgi:hypothetical protein